MGNVLLLKNPTLTLRSLTLSSFFFVVMCQNAVREMPYDVEDIDKCDFFDTYLSHLFTETGRTALREFVDVRYSSIVLALTLSPNPNPNS
jgi:hypothetical protein